jgi:exodeoxyribonuclease III
VKIATWNVNSIKVRLAHVLSWLESAQPDVLCLQEIKCAAEEFPTLELKGLGYHAAVSGQKSYNGVALLTKEAPQDVRIGLDGDPKDTQSRYIEATVRGARVASIYLPNGNPVETEKFPYKLAWMARLMARARVLLAGEMPTVLAGDYNVAPTDADVYDPEGWRGDALCRPESRRAFRALLHAGFTDAIRVFHPEPHRYTFWDYQAMRWNRDEGLRIDHLLLSPQAADRLTGAGVDKHVRAWEKPSDHVPVWMDLELQQR